MTLITSSQQYLEGPYLSDEYLLSQAQGSGGFQATFVIDSQKAVGMQSQLNILDKLSPFGMQGHLTLVDKLNAFGMQSHLNIVDQQTPHGIQASIQIVDTLNSSAMQASVTVVGTFDNRAMQTTVTINSERGYGMQTLVQIVDKLEELGMQARVEIVDYLRSTGFEVRLDKYPTSVCEGEEGYLSGAYLEDPYLTEIWCTRPGMQAHFSILDVKKPVGMQTSIQIANYLKNSGMQARLEIPDYLRSVGMQTDVQVSRAFGMQTLATIYNTTNLRILCDFPSRGLTSSNWTSSSTAAGDFSVQNLDTDIVEQVWRSAGPITGVRLTTDTGLAQGVFLDTLAILNHNLTRSANVILLGSNDPTFVSVGVSITLASRLNNTFYIAPSLPIAGYRYWRFEIDDATNTNGFLQIGTVVFGASEIFQGECFVDQIEFELRDFADTVRTEGFTNVANSRTQKRRLRLDFRSLNYQLRNFTIMRDMFERERTVTKCLWIPTPSATLPEITARFAVFGKLSTVPTETHNNKGPDQDWVTFTTDVDEAL